jgi:hypothetical protein
VCDESEFQRDPFKKVCGLKQIKSQLWDRNSTTMTATTVNVSLHIARGLIVWRTNRIT